MSRKIVGLARALGRSQSGNVLPIAAIGAVVMVSLVGGGVDMSRAYYAQNSLQNACDAAVLAGRRAVSSDGFDAKARRQADAFFVTNFDAASSGASETAFTVDSPDDGNTVEGVASTLIPTAVMQVFGFEQIPLSAACSASMSVGNSDVVMVLDTTGSMSWTLGGGGGTTRLEALQDAMKNFYDTVASAQAGSNARIRFGFVPYSSSVNVGELLYNANPDWLKDSHPVQSLEPVYVKVIEQQFDHWADPVYSTGHGYSDITYGNWQTQSGGGHKKSKQCENALPADTAWANHGGASSGTTETINGSGQKVETTTTQQLQTSTEYRCAKQSGQWYVQARTRQRMHYQYQYAVSDPVTVPVEVTEFSHFVYQQVDYDVSAYKAFQTVATPTGPNGSSQYSAWEGCIEERATVAASSFSFSSLFGMDPSDAYDLDIDMVPDASDPDTQWAPMWPNIAYYRTSKAGGSITNALTSNSGTQANSYCPHQAALLDEMSESEFDLYADSLQARGSTYHDLGMIWGARLSSPSGLFADHVNDAPANGGGVARHIIFMTDGEMAPNHSIQSAYGIEFHDRRVTSNGTSNHASRHRNRFLAACSAARAKGIRVWVIAFASALTSDLQNCASASSAYLAKDANELNAAFQEIAKDVGELRITG